MAQLSNAMLFLPTAYDTYVQAQGTPTATAPNQGLALILYNMTRTGATINTVAGFAYQPNSNVEGFEALLQLVRYVAETWNQR